MDKENASRGCLHWLLPGTKMHMVKCLVVHLTGDEQAEVSHVEKAHDKWIFLCHPKIEVPHYKVIYSTCRTKELNISITLQGRKTPCPICGSDSHLTNKCPKKHPRSKAATRQHQRQQPREESVGKKNEQATTADKVLTLDNIQPPSETEDDSFKIVDCSRKRLLQISPMTAVGKKHHRACRGNS